MQIRWTWATLLSDQANPLCHLWGWEKSIITILWITASGPRKEKLSLKRDRMNKIFVLIIKKNLQNFLLKPMMKWCTTVKSAPFSWPVKAFRSRRLNLKTSNNYQHLPSGDKAIPANNKLSNSCQTWNRSKSNSKAFLSTSIKISVRQKHNFSKSYQESKNIMSNFMKFWISTNKGFFWKWKKSIRE